MVPAQIKSQAGRYSTAGTRYSASGTRYSEPASRYSQPGTTGTAGTTKQFFFSFLFILFYFRSATRGYQIQYILERFYRDRAFIIGLPKRSNP